MTSDTPAGHDAALFTIAKANRDVMVVSSLIKARDIGPALGDDAGIDRVIRWCRDTGVTRLYLETYRGGVTADRNTLVHAKTRLQQAGLTVDGCVTTTKLGPPAVDPETDPNGYVVCYTRRETRDDCRRVFEFTASIFDVIMIDDFLFTTCDCERCEAAKGDRTWPQYRTDVMVDLSANEILGAARKVNPNAHVIVKFPNWYDIYHHRGYDVPRQTAMFDEIWVGNETREPTDKRWGRVQQYRGFFIQRWLDGFGGAKTGGGWFDGIDTTPIAYVEQARQTVLGGAKEMMLFNCISQMGDKHAGQMERFRAELPGLFDLARRIKGLPAEGIIAPRPFNSDAGREDGVYDYPGMLGLPLAPATEIPNAAKAVFLPVQALGEPNGSEKIGKLIAADTPVLMTDGLADALAGEIDVTADCVEILHVNGDPYSLRDIDPDQLARIRKHMLTPLGVALEAPALVSLYLLADRYVAIESFRDEPADIALEIDGLAGAAVESVLPVTESTAAPCVDGRIEMTLPARTLVVLRIDA